MNESRLEDIAAAAILDEMKTSVGSFVGYRELTRRLGVRHNIKEPKHKAFISARKSDSRGKTESKPHMLKQATFLSLRRQPVVSCFPTY